MKKMFAKKVLALSLVLSMGSMGAFAVPYGGISHIVEENYTASSPIGYFEEYKTDGSTIQNVGYWQPYQQVENGATVRSIQDIEVPQSYNRQIVTTDIDNRESIDKTIDRTGRVVGILGVASLFGLGIAALIHAL